MQHRILGISPGGALLLAASMLLAPGLSAQSPSFDAQALFGVAPRQRPPFETVEVTVSHVGGNIYQIRGEGGNIGMSVGEDGIVLIDDQFAPLTDKILTAIRTVSDAPIRFLINTHVHEDHTGGNANFANLGAVILAHDRVRIRLMEGIRGGPPAAPAALPVVTFSDPVSLHFNGEEVRIIPVPPAHTDGDAYVHFMGSNVIHTGDVFRTNGYPNIDLGNGGTLQGTLEGLQLLIDLAGPDTLLLPGHGVVSKRDAAIELRELALEVRDRVAPLVAQGMSLEEVVAAKPTADLDERWGPRLDRFLPAVYYGVGGQN